MLRRNVIISLVFIGLVALVLMTLIIFGKCCFWEQCEIPLRYGGNTPVFVSIHRGSFVYPQNGGAIVLGRDEAITIGCPGSTLNIGVVSTEVKCITGTNFFFYDENVDITSVVCNGLIKSTARYTGHDCEKSGKEIEVGFDFGDNKFVREMRICFDNIEQNSLYSEHSLTSFISDHELSPQRPYFDEGKGFYHLNGELFKLYDRPTQRATINTQLGLDANSTKIIQDGASFFLSRGHLAPKADFFYSTQQNASFYYVNSAPQWGIINSKSWNTLEWRIRSFVTKRKGDLQIFTGTYGNLKLENNESVPVPLFLYNSDSSKGIPIPEIFWKVVFDRQRRQGVAFICTNNPFLKKENIKFYCSDILNSLNWIKFNNRNTTQGFIYACTVTELRTKITFIPKLNEVGILNE